MKNKSFEEILKELEEKVKKLESGEVPLEEAIDLYTEAMKSVKLASDKLNDATLKVNKILAENGKLEEFDPSDNQ